MKPFLLLLLVLFAGNIIRAQKESFSGAFKEDFSDTALHYFHYGSTGNQSPFKWRSGVAATGDSINVLSFKIDPADSAGAGRGPEIISNHFTYFGSYSARLKVPHVRSIQPNTGAVVGYFTYYMDSVYGLSEIDFEWLVADPTIVYIGTWTGFNGQLKRIGRTINLAKGIIYNTAYREGYAGENIPLTRAQNKPDAVQAIAGYDASARFYTYGFDWAANRLTWWVAHPVTGKKIILWDYQGAQRGIPQHPSQYRMNFWHTNNWAVETNANALEKPLQPYELQVDWMKYEPVKK